MRTEQLRASLLELGDRIRAAPGGTQVVEFTRRELDHMEAEVRTATVYAPAPYKKRLVAVRKKVFDLLEAVRREEGDDDDAEAQR